MLTIPSRGTQADLLSHALHRKSRWFVPSLFHHGGLAFLILLMALTSSAQVAPSNVLTFHNDNGRTGQNLSEFILQPGNVNSANFGKLGFLAADGLVDAEPLYVSNLTVAGMARNVVYVVTEHDSVYAYDADTFAQLWKVTLLGAGETTSDARGCTQVTPEIGITSTPVIDLGAGPNGTIFVMAMSKGSSGTYYQRLHALDLTTGAEQTSSPTTIQATFPIPNSTSVLTFDPKQYKERAALLLLNGVIYTSWASHCDDAPYTGWVMGYSESSLQQVSVLNVTPGGNEGAFWMSGGGLAADSFGYVYGLDGNGGFDSTLDANGFPNKGNFGNAFLKMSTSSGLAVADYFEMYNGISESGSDVDLGSGGVMLLPDLTDSSQKVWHLAVGAGKDTHIYVVNRDSMGEFNSAGNSIYQDIYGVLSGGIYSVPAYFNNTVYFGQVGNPIVAFSINNAKLLTPPSSQTATSYTFPGTTPSISANGSSNAILWAIQNTSPAVLHAYDATKLSTELYNSNQAANSRDQFGAGNKFMTPMVNNGKVYVGTATGVAVFGLLNGGVPQAAPPTFNPTGGTITTSQPIALSDSTPTTSIYYTTNGTPPSVTPAELYSAPFTLSAGATVQAMAVATGYTNSTVASATYAIGIPGLTRVDSGGAAYTDTLGNAWSADTGYTGGSAASVTTAITNTPDQKLYQSERYGAFSYSFAAPAGTYSVTLKFAEIYFTASGKRIFSVAINGTTVLSNFDIFAQAGAANKAVDKTFTVNSTGTIAIQFITGSADLPKVSAIQIVPYSGVGVQVSPTTVSLTAGQQQPFTTTVTGTTNTAVNWSMSPQVGTMGGTGLYTAPGTISAGQTITITATSVADATQSATATVTLVPPNFSISASPSSQTIVQGSGTTYTPSVTATGGFSAAVTFSISGLPTGAGGTFSPGSVTGSGTSTLSVTTAATTPTGSYTLTITGTSGTLVHTTTVMLAVGTGPNFSITASPSSQTVLPGGGTTYTPSVTATGGFSAVVTFSVSGFPTGAGGTFNPTSVAGSGTSTLSVTTASTTPTGSYTLTITGTSGTLVHSTTVTLVASPPAGSFTPVRVDSGGAAYTDTLGNAWKADTGFTGGSAASVTTAITNTPDQKLYQSERYGAFSYSFAAPAGTYSVTLKFAEIYFTASGKRIFSVAINGTTVLSNFDIFAQAGAANKAVDKTFTVNSTGTITIQFITGSADLPKVSAVQIVAYSGVAIQISPTTVSLTGGQQQPFTATVTGSSNTGVNWTMTPTVGTLSGAGLYTAPATITTQQVVTVTATSAADPSQLANAQVTLIPAFTGIRVRSGGVAYTDPQGNVWSADTGFTGGSTSTTTAAITNTTTPALYQGERWGSTFTYTFAVPNGSHTVTLKFAEIYWTAVGQRIFNVAINGTAVLTNFDIIAQAGAANKAWDLSFPVNVTSGTVTIQFTSGSADDPKISSIQIQ